ncbi:MAG: ArsA family ATPase, partial [Chloroflexota bacterium]
MRILLYTGKGGAGKTTIAAATAVRCAEMGRRTLILASDASQSLADCLNSPIGDDPLEVAPGLWAQEVDPLERLEQSWPRVAPSLASAFQSEMTETALEELTLAPGLGDVIRLLALKDACEDEKRYDVVVVDLGSSLAALELLAYPESTGWWAGRLLSGSRSSSLAKTLEHIAEGLAELRIRLESEESSVRIVTTSERLALRETERALTFVSLHGYNIDALVINRQKRVPRPIREALGAWPILTLRSYDREIVGLGLLSDAALALYPPAIDPADVLLPGPAQQLTRDSEGYL